MAGYAAHGIVCLFVVHFALQRVGADAGKGNSAVPGVAVQLGGCAVIGAETMLQGLIGDVGQAHRLPKDLGKIVVQTRTGELLDHKIEQHIIDV